MKKRIDQIGMVVRTYWEAWSAIGRLKNYDRLVTVQSHKLQKMISYAVRHVKYYREMFESAGLKAEDIRDARDLEKVPILTKTELRNRFWDFFPQELPACRVSRTSGSTGIPVCIFSDQNSRICNSAGVFRYRMALGMGLAGRPIITPMKTPKDPWDKSPHWTHLQGLHKTFYVNPYVDTQENERYIGKMFEKLQGAALIGITPAIRKLCYRIRDGQYPRYRPSIILTTGEVLTAEVREMLEETFEAKVADIYGCNEGGDIAWQCTRGAGYHINMDNVILEILRDGQPVKEGQVGEVVITNLNRYAMPIIRYKNGDYARAGGGDCPCGCKLPLLAEIIGRSGEDITLPDGRIIPWNQLKGVLNDPRIRQFQVVQNVDAGLNVKYVHEPGVDKSTLEKLICQRLREILGSAVSIELVPVMVIAPAESGKSKLVISHYRQGLEYA